MKMTKKQPIIGASALVRTNKKDILLVKRLNEPGESLWAFPGGKVDPGETVEETAVREVKEETNIKIKLTELMGPYDIISDDYHYVTICFKANPCNKDIIVGSDVGMSKWVSPSDLHDFDLTSTTEMALKDASIL